MDLKTVVAGRTGVVWAGVHHDRLCVQAVETPQGGIVGTATADLSEDTLGLREPRLHLDKQLGDRMGYCQVVQWASKVSWVPALVDATSGAAMQHRVWQVVRCRDSYAGQRQHAGLAAMLK